MSVPTCPAAPLDDAKESAPHPVTTGSPEAAPDCTAGPGTAPAAFDANEGPAPEEPLVGVGQVDAQSPVSEWTPLGGPSPDSSGGDSAQVKVGRFCAVFVIDERSTFYVCVLRLHRGREPFPRWRRCVFQGQTG